MIIGEKTYVQAKTQTVHVVYEFAVTLNLIYKSKVNITVDNSETADYSVLYLSYVKFSFSFIRKGERCAVSLNNFFM